MENTQTINNVQSFHSSTVQKSNGFNYEVMDFGTAKAMEHRNFETSIRFLGTGTSIGIPRIGCQCETCLSTDPKDKRLRQSALLQIITDKGEVNILIDCGPDFRQQALQYGITELDAILLTHEHYDHVGGLDDVRPLGETNIYAEQRVLDAVHRVMPYCFGAKHYPGAPTINLHQLNEYQSFNIKGITITPLRVLHGKLPILGYHFTLPNSKTFAYITDASALPEKTLSTINCQLSTLIINALQIPTHPAHFSLQESLEIAAKVNAQATYFIHFSDKIGLHQRTSQLLPANTFLAFDGLQIQI